MSRIHEALKKAEQERAAVQTASTDILMATPIEVAPSHGPFEPETQVTSRLIADKVVATTGGYLRFDELSKHCAHPKWHLDPNVNVFINPELGAHGAEQFRTLRSRLYQIRSAQTLRTLLVTSSLPAEGKSFVTCNLAQAIVRQPDRRVLIIDADLRCSRLHVPLGAPASPGLTDYLRGEADEMAIIQHGLDGNRVSSLAGLKWPILASCFRMVA